jgi:hypothetical protein
MDIAAGFETVHPAHAKTTAQPSTQRNDRGIGQTLSRPRATGGEMIQLRQIIQHRFGHRD